MATTTEYYLVAGTEHFVYSSEEEALKALKFTAQYASDDDHLEVLEYIDGQYSGRQWTPESLA